MSEISGKLRAVAWLFVAVATGAVQAGCGDSDVGGPSAGSPQARLDQGRARWEAANIVDYRFRYTRSCECLPEDLTSPAIEVRAGTIVKVWDVATGDSIDAANFDRYFSIERLFDLIQEAIDRPAYRIEATYHWSLGHPTVLFIDYDAIAADEEMDFPLIGGVEEIID